LSRLVTKKFCGKKRFGVLDNKKILITGATGSFGNRFIEMTCAKYKPKRVIVFSRDEMKQWEMRKKYADLPLDYFLGDVRDLPRLKRAFAGADVVIHAAALKIVPVAEYDPFECVKTNILGAMNVIDAAIDCGVKRIVALSTDKACSPINLYGATKLCSDKLFLAANAYRNAEGPRFSVVRYGNVMGSRGSVIPLFLQQAKSGSISVTAPEMTRFMITLDQAVELVWDALKDPAPKIHIPRLPAMNIMDIAAVCAPGCAVNYIGIRPGEKIHEQLDENYTSDKPERWMEQWELKNWIESNYGPSRSPTPVFSSAS
jgi:UDP-N-acetylglucosamine 4,6-dehydratase